MRHETIFPRKIIEHQDMGIVMPDGCRLSARVWMPEDAARNPVPVILEHLPYRKRDGTIVRDQFSHPWMAGQGYCCIRTDMRGNGESEGLMTDEYTKQELQDACDVIAWAARQKWCNGNVGMQGISWGGFNGLQVAALRPPALKAVITICSSADRYADDIHFKGGSLLLENFGWSVNMMSYSSRPPDPKIVGDKWTSIWKNRLENQPFNWIDWLGHQQRDDYWKHGSICEDFSRVEAAVLSVGGWHDGYRNTIANLVENLTAPVKGIVGPWNHKYPHYAGPKPAIGFLQESKRWWDKWLKGIETHVESDPDYRAYVMESVSPARWYETRPGRWIAEQDWPSSNINKKKLFLCPDGLCNSSTNFEIKVKSPEHCGQSSGEYFPFAFAAELPDEQALDDASSACFDGEPLDHSIDIIGAPILRLNVSSDKPNAQLVVRLNDLRPDGTSALITYGVLNLTHHTSHEHPSELSPHQRYDFQITLDQIAYNIPADHRLRIAVSTCYWPKIWPSPEKAEVSIHYGSIEIPSRPITNTGDEIEFEEPVGAPPCKTEELRPASYDRATATDAKTGIVTTSIFADNGENKDLTHGLISGSWMKENFYIHPDNPTSAKATAEWEQTGGRTGQMWRTQVTAEMTCDVENLYTKHTLKSYLNGEEFFAKEFKGRVEREFV